MKNPGKSMNHFNRFTFSIDENQCQSFSINENHLESMAIFSNNFKLKKVILNQ